MLARRAAAAAARAAAAAIADAAPCTSRPAARALDGGIRAAAAFWGGRAPPLSRSFAAAPDADDGDDAVLSPRVNALVAEILSLNLLEVRWRRREAVGGRGRRGCCAAPAAAAGAVGRGRGLADGPPSVGRRRSRLLIGPCTGARPNCLARTPRPEGGAAAPPIPAPPPTRSFPLSPGRRTH
jgi:hypothetical protein